jgi:hypothetical protein
MRRMAIATGLVVAGAVLAGAAAELPLVFGRQVDHWLATRGPSHRCGWRSPSQRRLERA